VCELLVVNGDQHT